MPKALLAPLERVIVTPPRLLPSMVKWTAVIVSWLFAVSAKVIVLPAAAAKMMVSLRWSPIAPFVAMQLPDTLPVFIVRMAWRSVQVVAAAVLVSFGDVTGMVAAMTRMGVDIRQNNNTAASGRHRGVPSSCKPRKFAIVIMLCSP